MLDEAISKHTLVLVDDLHLVTDAVGSLDSLLLDAELTAVLGDAAGQRKKLVFATSGEAPWPVRRRALIVEIGPLRLSGSVGPRPAGEKLETCR